MKSVRFFLGILLLMGLVGGASSAEIQPIYVKDYLKGIVSQDGDVCVSMWGTQFSYTEDHGATWNTIARNVDYFKQVVQLGEGGELFLIVGELESECGAPHCAFFLDLSAGIVRELGDQDFHGRIAVNSFDPSIWYMSHGTKLKIYGNYGQTQLFCNYPITGGAYLGGLYATSKLDQNTLYAVGTSACNQIFKSVSNGRTFTPYHTPPLEGERYEWLLHLSNGDLLAGSREARYHYSSEGTLKERAEVAEAWKPAVEIRLSPGTIIHGNQCSPDFGETWFAIDYDIKGVNNINGNVIGFDGAYRVGTTVAELEEEYPSSPYGPNIIGVVSDSEVICRYWDDIEGPSKNTIYNKNTRTHRMLPISFSNVFDVNGRKIVVYSEEGLEELNVDTMERNLLIESSYCPSDLFHYEDEYYVVSYANGRVRIENSENVELVIDQGQVIENVSMINGQWYVVSYSLGSGYVEKHYNCNRYTIEGEELDEITVNAGFIGGVISSENDVVTLIPECEENNRVLVWSVEGIEEIVLPYGNITNAFYVNEEHTILIAHHYNDSTVRVYQCTGDVYEVQQSDHIDCCSNGMGVTGIQSGKINGIYYVNNVLLNYDEFQSDVSDHFFVSLPSKSALTSVYPNPFNALGIATYTLAHETHVSLTVCNLLGQMVAVLAEGDTPAGVHSIVLPGDRLATGSYFVVLKTPFATDVHRFTVVK